MTAVNGIDVSNLKSYIGRRPSDPGEILRDNESTKERTMSRIALRKPARLLIGSSLAIVLLAGGVAFVVGTIPGADGVIHGCYNNSKGDLRVIDPTTDSCGDRESAIFWNQEGVPGQNGTNGTNGTNGVDGTNGTNGTDGTNGVSGYQNVISPSIGVIGFGDTFGIVTCPSGKMPMGGGVFNSSSHLIIMVESHPTESGWAVRVRNTSNSTQFFAVRATCANVTT